MKTNEALVLWETHKYTPLVERLSNATMFQKTFFMMMAGKDISFRQTIDMKLEGIAKGVGVEFKKKR